MRLFQVFQNQFAAPGTVKCEDHCAKRPKQAAQASRHAGFHVAAVDGLAAQRADHCTIGRDEGRIRSQAQPFEQRRGVGGAPAGGDGHRDAGLLRGLERLGVARADALREGRQQGAVHVDRHQANGRVHVPSVPAPATPGCGQTRLRARKGLIR